jgi:NAD(P)H-dependent FMN reductase
VSPSCNVEVPGGIKSAIEYLYSEIKGKSCLIISYGVLTKGKSAHVIETRLTLSFAENESLGYGLSFEMRLADTRKLWEESLKHWADKKSNIIKGFEELKAYLLKVPGPTPA